MAQRFSAQADSKQQRQSRSLVAGWGDQTTRAVRWPRGLHTVDSGVHKDVLDAALLRAARVDTAGVWVVGRADFHVLDDDEDVRERLVATPAGRDRDDSRRRRWVSSLRQTLDDRVRAVRAQARGPSEGSEPSGLR